VRARHGCISAKYIFKWNTLVTGVAKGGSYGFDGMYSNPHKTKKCSFLQNHPERPWGPHSHLFIGHHGCLLEIKRPWFENGQSPPFSAEIMSEWSYTCTPPVRLHGVDRGSFNFTYWRLVINTYGPNFLLHRHSQGHTCSYVSTTVGQLPIIFVGNIASITWVLFVLSFGFR
jgi:hypothetical protein